MNIEQARFNMVEQQIRPWNVSNPDILALLGRIEATQDEMSRIMKAVVQPRAEP